MSDTVNELLRQFAAQPPLLLQVLLRLLEDAAHKDHPAILSLCENLPQLLLSIYNVNDTARQSMHTWTMSITERVFSVELTALSNEQTGLHFNAKNATAENLESFSIRKLAKTMENTAPVFWSFLDMCLNADVELVKDRESYAAKKEKRLGLNRESGRDHETAEDDVYYAEYGVINELEDTSQTIPMKSLRSQRESLQTIKKVTLMSIIAKSTNQKCNAFASVMGLFAHSSRAPERLIETLAHAGLSISVNAINEAVTSLSNEASKKLKELGKSLTVAYAYDNFDVALDVATPTAEGGGNTLAHLTSGTLLKLEHGVTPEDLECSEEIWKTNVFNLKKVPGPKHDIIDLLNLHVEEDPPASGLTRRQRFQAWKFRHDLVYYGPEYFRQFKEELGDPETIEEVPLSKACQVPASAMDINESTTKGNIDAVEHLLRQANTGDPQESPGVADMTKHVILIHGDLSTMERIQSAQASRALEQTPWRRFQYVVFIPGLFHVKMACADAIWRVLVEPSQSRVDASSTMELAGIFWPQQTGKIGSNPGFRMMHDLIQQDGLARRLDCWRIDVQKRRPAVVDLAQYSELKPSWDEICSISNVLAVYFVAQGSFSRRRAPEQRDADFENSLLRNQYYLLYEEITHAMNGGDIGRVEDVLATWIMLFKGCGKMKYSAQMARFLTDLHFVYPERLRRAIRLNWLCNPRGLAGMFHGIDWLLERNNLYTKHIYGGSFSTRTIPYIIKELVLIELYRKLHVNIEDNFCLTNRTIHHTPADLTSTLAKASSWIQRADPHRFRAGKTVKYNIIDAVRKGSALLMVGDISVTPAEEEEAVMVGDIAMTPAEEEEAVTVGDISVTPAEEEEAAMDEDGIEPEIIVQGGDLAV